jgi:hypothetical protein
LGGNNATASLPCYQAAASPFDKNRPAGVAGVTLDKIDLRIAIPACEAAAKASPNDPRIMPQLGRAYQAAKACEAATDRYCKAADQGFAPAPWQGSGGCGRVTRNMSNSTEAVGADEAERHDQIYNDLRTKLLDLSRRNPMLNYKHRAGSRRHLRIVNANYDAVYSELIRGEKELSIVSLPEPDNIPDDERTQEFMAALGHAKATDIDYLTRREALETVARQDEGTLAELDRRLRDCIREQLGMPPRPDRRELNLFEHARKHGINPSYELAREPANGQQVNRLQTLQFSDDLDSRLARIAADAKLAEQESGLSTLFLAFGFLRWYESNASDVPNFAPLLLLPVELKKRMEARRATYCINAAAEAQKSISAYVRSFCETPLT